MRRLEYVSGGAGQLSAAFTGMVLEPRHRDRVPGLGPQGGGFGARNVGRPTETVAGVRDRYSKIASQVDRSIRSLRLSVACMPVPAAARPADLERLNGLLRALEAAESFMEDAGPWHSGR